MDEGSKACTMCGETKPLEAFHRNANHPTGRNSACIVCRKARYYDSELARDRRRNAERWRNNPEYRAYKRAYLRRWKLAKKFGLTVEQWEAIFDGQGRICAICGGAEHNGINWHTDHDRSCCPGENSCGQCVRGILCGPCNVGIGHFKDSVDRLAAAQRYLQRWVIATPTRSSLFD